MYTKIINPAIAWQPEPCSHQEKNILRLNTTFSSPTLRKVESSFPTYQEICKRLISWRNHLRMLYFSHWGTWYVARNELIILLFVITFRMVNVSRRSVKIYGIKRDWIRDSNRGLSISFWPSSHSWILLIFLVSIHILRPNKPRCEVVYSGVK